MSYEIFYLEPAAEEIEEAFFWYENKKVGLGLELLREVDDYLLLIKENPFLFEENKNRSNLRNFPLVKFPYSVFYWISESQKVIYIDAFFHAKRKPRF